MVNLKWAPKSVGIDFYCDNNILESLEGAPEYVGGIFNCYGNSKLSSLKHLPKHIGGKLYLNECPNLIEYSPLLFSKIEGTIYTDNEKVKAIENIMPYHQAV